MNVPALLTAITLPLLVSGCGSFGWRSDVQPVEIQKRAVERTPLRLPDPAPLQARELEWIVVTPENANEVWKKLKDGNTDVVVFALTDDGYEALAVDTAETRNYIARVRRILEEYRNYYEPKKNDTAK